MYNGIEEDVEKIIKYCRNEMNFTSLLDFGFHYDIADILEYLITRNKESEKLYNIAYTGGKSFERQQWKEKMNLKIKYEKELTK